MATVSEGSRGGQLTKRCFSSISTSVKAEVQMLAEGLHGQVLRKSVCFGVVDEILLGSEKEQRRWRWSVSRLGCLTENLRLRLNCRREGCRSLVRYRGGHFFFREKVEKLDDVEYIRFVVCCKILPTPFLFNHCDTYNTTITPNATYTGLSIPFPPYSYYHSRHMCSFRLIQLETERGL